MIDACFSLPLFVLVFSSFLTGLFSPPRLEAGAEAMKHGGRSFLGTALAITCDFWNLPRRQATGVPVGGFLPLVGIGLSNEDNDDGFDTQRFTTRRSRQAA